MHYHFSFYSSLLLIFFSQGLIFSILLFKKGIKEEQTHFKWLALFIGLCSIYLLPFMLGFAGWYSLQPYRDILFYLPLQQTLFIGPAIYFFTLSLLNPSFKFTSKHSVHMIPGFIYLLFALLVFVMDNLVLEEVYFYADGRDMDFDTWYQVVGLASMLFYAILCIRYYLVYRRFIFEYLSFADYTQLKWINRFLWVFSFMVLIQLVFFVIFPDWGNFLQKWWYYFAFAVLNYYIGIQGLITPTKGTVPFFLIHNSNLVVGDLPIASPLQLESTNYHGVVQEDLLQEGKDSEDEELFLDWKNKLESLVESKELFKNPTLALLDLANYLNSNPTFISKIVNRAFQMNFNDWINSYRVKEVISRLQGGAHLNQTLLGIALDCGFNSKTTFNRCFVKMTGMPPNKFVKNLAPNHDLGRTEF